MISIVKGMMVVRWEMKASNRNGLVVITAISWQCGEEGGREGGGGLCLDQD